MSCLPSFALNSRVFHSCARKYQHFAMKPVIYIQFRVFKAPTWSIQSMQHTCSLQIQLNRKYTACCCFWGRAGALNTLPAMLDVQELTYPAATVCLQRKQEEEGWGSTEESEEGKREDTEARNGDESRRKTADSRSLEVGFWEISLRVLVKIISARDEGLRSS